VEVLIQPVTESSDKLQNSLAEWLAGQTEQLVLITESTWHQQEDSARQFMKDQLSPCLDQGKFYVMNRKPFVGFKKLFCGWFRKTQLVSVAKSFIATHCRCGLVLSITCDQILNMWRSTLIAKKTWGVIWGRELVIQVMTSVRASRVFKLFTGQYVLN